MAATRMLTLFGEEIVPENLQGAPRPVAGITTAVLADWQPEKQYYTIGEVAKLFAVRSSHIRFWTTEFALKVRTTRKGDRLYSPEIIRELRAIYHLVKERGFTIPGAKARLKDAAQPAVETLHLRQALLRLRNQLLTIRNELL